MGVCYGAGVWDAEVYDSEVVIVIGLSLISKSREKNEVNMIPHENPNPLTHRMQQNPKCRVQAPEPGQIQTIPSRKSR